jgi:uncharacterized protein YecE (DUF72 family)
MAAATKDGTIRVGIGGWSYAPWRGVFYPKGVKQADELTYAASRLTSIEINATHYRLQSPKSFRIWGATAPDGFVFSVKGPRLVTQQKMLAETGGFVRRFVESPLAIGGRLDQSAGRSILVKLRQCRSRDRRRSDKEEKRERAAGLPAERG